MLLRRNNYDWHNQRDSDLPVYNKVPHCQSSPWEVSIGEGVEVLKSKIKEKSENPPPQHTPSPRDFWCQIRDFLPDFSPVQCASHHRESVSFAETNKQKICVQSNIWKAQCNAISRHLCKSTALASVFVKELGRPNKAEEIRILLYADPD